MDDQPAGTPGLPRPPSRLFTLEQANQLLPRIVPTLIELRARKAALDEARAALARLTPAMRGNGHGASAAELEGRVRQLVDDLAAGVRRIAELGVEVKDLDRGLVDFPARREDRVVYLCWQLGEGAISWWHEVDAGFAGRRPL